jgi:hypothetical protein
MGFQIWSLKGLESWVRQTTIAIVIALVAAVVPLLVYGDGMTTVLMTRGMMVR